MDVLAVGELRSTMLSLRCRVPQMLRALRKVVPQDLGNCCCFFGRARCPDDEPEEQLYEDKATEGRSKVLRALRRCVPKKLGTCRRVFGRGKCPDEGGDQSLRDEEEAVGESEPPLLSTGVVEDIDEEPTAYDYDKDLSDLDNDAEFNSNFLAPLEQLAADQSTASRLFACKMLSVYYDKVSPAGKFILRNKLRRLCLDDNMEVKIRAMGILTDLAQNEFELFSSWITPIRDEILEYMEATRAVETAFFNSDPKVLEDLEYPEEESTDLMFL